MAQELRRAGFAEDSVFPRRVMPRVLAPELARLQRDLPSLKPDVARVLERYVKGSRDAVLVGEFYEKQVDVVIADWRIGAELIISTKSQLSSFGNNLKNRFEEGVGDLRNLRGRYPLAALGFVFLVRSTILDEPRHWEFAKDMVRKLRMEDRGYDATALIVAHWTEDARRVGIVRDEVPHDLELEGFLGSLVGAVLARSPASRHTTARTRRHGEAPPAGASP